MDKRTKDIIVGTLAVGAAAFSIYYALAGRSPKINLDTYNVLGAVTAEECARLMGNQGQVLVMVPDTGPNKNPSVEEETKALEQTLKKRKGLTAVTEKVKVTPMIMMATGGGVPAEQFFQALEKHKDAAAVALFFGFPELTDSDLETLRKRNVKTVVISFFRSDYKRLLDRGAIHLVIAPRHDTPPASTQPPRTVRERFDQDFVMMTPEQAGR